MSATTIHFVRHGKVYNPDHLLYERLPDFHLSDLGRRMAQATATYLAKNPQTNTIAAVYSSPLDRTRETAGAILDALNPVREARGEAPLTLTTDERVIEAGYEFRGKRIGHGEGALWKNGNWKLVTNLYKPSWGESYQHIAARMDDFAREKVAQHPGEQIVVVSHESPIFSYPLSGDRPPRALDVPAAHGARLRDLGDVRQRNRPCDVNHVCRPSGQRQVTAHWC